MSFLPINIDTSGFADAVNIAEGDIKQFTTNMISELAAEFAMRWGEEASALGSTRQQFKNSIYVNKIDDFSYEVGLTGFLSNAIEQGISGFDQKEGFEKSSKKTFTKDGEGWYLTIPFRHASAGALGESSAFSNKMPSEVYKVAKKLPERTGLDVKALPKEFQARDIRPEVVTKSKIFEEYQHKHSIHSGIVKKQDDTGRGTYSSFRRVSSNSDDNSWIHSGIEAHNFGEKAFTRMDIPATIDNLANKYMDELI